MVEVFDSEIQQTVEDLKSLKIQGASHVREAIVKALSDLVKRSNAQTVEELQKELQKNAIFLLSARATEPEAKTAVRIILKSIQLQSQNVEVAKQAVLNACADYEKNRIEALKKISEYGSNLIPQNATIFTHCHSDTVESILEKAHDKIKEIYCTETRPKFQGRITAQNLLNKGFKVTMIVDSGAATFLKKCDLFITGADAILADGSAVNKIGTALISNFAKHADVPHYIATSSHKFDPTTYFGIPEEIEERNPAEVWDTPPKGLKIRNPAFDITQSTSIQSFITEKGVFTPRIFALEMYRELDLGRRKDEYLELLKLMQKYK